MVNVPLIQGNSIQEINTSIVAIKKAQKELEALNTLEDNKIKALNLALSGGSGKFIQSISQTEGQVAVEVGELTDTIVSGNTQPATSNGVADAIANQDNVIIATKQNQYSIGNNENKYGLNLNNSDIINYNAFWANDVAQEKTGEGINFKRSNDNYDNIRAVDGKIYLETNLNKITAQSDGSVEIPAMTKVDGTVTNIVKKNYKIGDLNIVIMRAAVSYNVNNPSGAIYYSLCSGISFPITFKEKPVISMFTEYNGGNAWCWGATHATVNNTGDFYIARGTSATVPVLVHIIAIGE